MSVVFVRNSAGGNLKVRRFPLLVALSVD